LQEARAAGLQLAIATTTSPENVTALLNHSLAADGESWFDVIGAGDIVPAKKPAPDIYQWVLRQLRLDAAQALAFEDSENGIRASRGAGLKTVITVNDYTRRHDFSDAALVVDQLGDPGHPCRVLSGDLDGATYVTVDVLRRVHGLR
jgi:beta-phosphoglucomutase-like phosphatase (HAD superfamily)